MKNNNKFTIKIKGATPEIMNDIKFNLEDYRTYVETGNVEVHDEMLRTSGNVFIEMMSTNKVIIRRGKHFTTIYISNDELFNSYQIQILNKTISGVSMEF